jgi:hypothetical protein
MEGPQGHSMGLPVYLSTLGVIRLFLVLSFAVTPGATDRAACLPAARASFAFCVAFLPLPTRVSLAGAVDGGGTEGAVRDALG